MWTLRGSMSATARSSRACRSSFAAAISLFVHSSAERPADWTYVTDPVHASASLRAAGTRYVFSGHVHEPILYYTALADRPVAFKPVPGVAIPSSPPPVARDRRLRRPAARWQHRRVLAPAGSRGRAADVPTRAVRLVHHGREDPRQAPGRLAHRLERGVNLGALDPGTVVDAFVVEEQVHAGGMAVLYRVSAPDAAFPLIMKVPRLGPGEPASSVISFEIEQMVLAALRGARAALRDLARGRRAAVHRHGVRPGPLARRVGGARATSCGGGGAARRRGGDGAARASPPGRDPPRRGSPRTS